jgi:hypothetical protein
MASTEINFKNTLLRRREDIFITSLVGDEMVLMNIETGKYFGINSVGVALWNLLEQRKSFHQLIEEILIEFEVAEDQAKSEVMEFLTRLDQYDMLEVQ